MKQGMKSIENLYGELIRQREARMDLIANTRSLSVSTENGISTLSIFTDKDIYNFKVTDIAHRQIADRLGIPFKYYERMMNEYPKLLDENVNSWLKFKAEKRMLRTLDGKLRAFLSNRYRRLDNLELVDHILPVIAQMKNCSIASCDITETHLYLKVINKSMKAEITEGDIVQAGFVVSNSEIGLGALKVEPLVYRLVCKNGMISKDYAHKKYHTGRNVEDTDNAYELYSDETLKADDKKTPRDKERNKENREFRDTRDKKDFNKNAKDGRKPQSNNRSENQVQRGGSLMDILKQKGYEIITGATLANNLIDFIGVAGKKICVCLLDKEPGDWLADEERFNDEEPLWFSESSHRISPVRKVDLARQHLIDKLENADFHFDVKAYVIEQIGNIINAEDMFEIWDDLGVCVTRIDRGTPKELKLFSKTLDEAIESIDKDKLEKIKKLIRNVA